MLDDRYINNLAKVLVCAGQAIFWEVYISPKCTEVYTEIQRRFNGVALYIALRL